MDDQNGHTNGNARAETGTGASTAENGRRRARRRDYKPAYEEPDRTPASDRDNAFNALAWFLEGAAGLAEELRHNDLAFRRNFGYMLWPPAARRCWRCARF